MVLTYTSMTLLVSLLLTRNLARHVIRLAAIIPLVFKVHLLSHDHLAVGLLLQTLRVAIIIKASIRISLKLSETDLVRVDVFSVLLLPSVVHGVHVAL